MASQYKLTIAGEQVSVPSEFDVVDPSTGAVFAQAPAAGSAEVDFAFSSAEAAFPAWSADSKARRAALHAIADVTESAADELGRILSLETGKPHEDSRWEFRLGALWMRYYADLDVEVQETSDSEGYRATVARRPLGVVAAIKPWNTPIIQLAWAISPALRAGNTVVLKPSPFTPLSSLALASRISPLLPPGVLNVVTGPDPLGELLTSHRTPRKITFTGSTRAGTQIATAAAGGLKHFTLEMGGNDPALILPGADIAAIASPLFWASLMNNGQICGDVKRIYVHRSQHADLVDALASIATSTKVGGPFEDDVQLGPVSTRPQYDRVVGLLNRALSEGARAASGGAPIDGPGFFVPPTVLDNVDDGSAIVDEEQFGPLIPVVAYDDIEDGIRRANRTDFGLSASVWGPDLEQNSAIVTRLQAGMVSVNQHGFGARPDLPFLGHKSSGFGVENGLWGLEEYTQLQVIGTPGAGPRPDVEFC